MAMEIPRFLWALCLNKPEGPQEISPPQLETCLEQAHTLWLHVDYSDSATEQWLRDQHFLDPQIAGGFFAEDTRPRSLTLKQGLFLILRGLNLNPGAEPEDMVSLRVWIEPTRIITAQRRTVHTFNKIHQSFLQRGITITVSDFAVELIETLVNEIADVVEEAEEEIDNVEENMVTSTVQHDLRTRLADLRREIISLRRYLAPQREVMLRLSNEQIPWLSEHAHHRLRDAADRLTKYVEDLDSARERAAITQEELHNKITEMTSKRIYIFTLIASIFLPLSFLTSLLGINVGGIPGSTNSYAFFIVCGILGFIALTISIIFRIKKWL